MKASSWGVAAAAAAAVAVVIYAAIALPGLLSEDNGEGAPTRRAGGALALDSMPIGAEPRSGYLAGAEFRRGAERQVFALDPGTQVTEFVPISGGHLLSVHDESGSQLVRFVGDDGTSSEVWEVEYGSSYPTVVASGDGRLGAFVPVGGAAVVVQDEGRTMTEFPVPEGAFDIGFSPVTVSGTDCTGTDPDCVLLMHGVDTSGGGTRATTWKLRPGRPAETVPTEFRELTTMAANGSSAGVVKIIHDGDGACEGVAGPGGTVLWSTCEDRLVSFSPDSTWVLSSTSAHYGSGDHELTLLNARTGKEKLRLETARDVGIYEMVWEDEDHVLAVVSEWFDPGTGQHQRHRWGIVRISLDGTREYAVTPVKGEDDDYDGPLDLPQG